MRGNNQSYLSICPSVPGSPPLAREQPTRRTLSTASAISSQVISTLSKSQMHISCGRAAGLRHHTSCSLFTAMHLTTFIWKCLRKPSQRSKICVKPIQHRNKKRPAKRQIQRSTGFLNAGSGVEPARNDGVMPSNAKLCQVPCQNKKRAEPKPRRNIVKNVC